MDQSQPLRLRHLDGRLPFLGGAGQALAVDGKRVRKDVTGLTKQPKEVFIIYGY